MNAQTATAATPLNTKIVTGKVRVSYPHLFKPRLNDLNGREEYSASLLIPKSDTKTAAQINTITEALVKLKWGNKPPANFRHPLRDGDTEREDEAYRGHWFINVRSTQAPQIVDRQLNPVFDTNALVAGDYIRASLNAYAYDQKGNRGVGLGLNNIQILESGEPLSSRARPEVDFADDYAEENPW